MRKTVALCWASQVLARVSAVDLYSLAFPDSFTRCPIIPRNISIVHRPYSVSYTHLDVHRPYLPKIPTQAFLLDSLANTDFDRHVVQ